MHDMRVSAATTDGGWAVTPPSRLRMLLLCGEAAQQHARAFNNFFKKERKVVRLLKGIARRLMQLM